MFKSIFKDCIPILEEFAPMLASALGHPTAGAIAFGILNSIYKLTNDSVLDVPKTISGNPDLLKQAENDFMEWAHNNLEKDENNKFKFS